MVDCRPISQGTAYFVDDLLTTRQLQELLQVDRITIYRMLNDGRLPGFKVGSQWRFSRQEIEQWLQEQRISLHLHEAASLPEDSLDPSAHALPRSCIQAMQVVYAEALDIAAVTTDLNGIPLTDVSNSCAFCDLILASPEGRRRCGASWKAIPGGFRTCHAGLLCASAPIHVGGERVAHVAGCQFVAQPASTQPERWEASLSDLATDLDLSETDLRSAVGTVRSVPEEQLSRAYRLLLQVAETFSEIGEERLALLSRLQRIAEITNLS
jgi:excisionase family DNA binding protein